MESIFPKMIKNLSFYKEHEDLAKSNPINFIERNLYQGESIVFKYYVSSEDLGSTGIQSMIKTPGFFHEETTNFRIIKRDPKFEAWYWCPSKELVKGNSTEFCYYIKYLGGDEEKKAFRARINPVTNSANHENLCTVDPNKEYNFTLMKGETFEIKTNVTYNKARFSVSPPIISVDGLPIKAEISDLSIYENEEMLARLSFENRTLKNQEIANYMYFLSLLIALSSVIEIWFMYQQHIQSQKDREASNKVIENLTRIINKRLGPPNN